MTEGIDFAGQRFGMLVVQGRSGMMLASGKERYAWDCRCDCGGTRRLSSAILCQSTAQGHVLCCGCVRRRPDMGLTMDWLFARCMPLPWSGCWVWMGALNNRGYGQIRVANKCLLAHIVSFRVSGGAIPSGYVVDHLCRVEPCINPAHLEPVTHSVNTLRGKNSALKPTLFSCPHGHPYEGDNRYESGGKVFCRACNKAATARYRERKRGAQPC